MTDITKAITAAREALARLREHDGGTRYNDDDDDAGERACCLVASWKPHDSDCPHAVAVAEFDRILSALDAAQPVAYLWPGSIQALKAGQRPVEALLWTTPTGQAGVPIYLAPQAQPAAVPEGFAALVDAADNAYDRSAEGVAYVEFYRREPVEKLLAACWAMLAAARAAKD